MFRKIVPSIPEILRIDLLSDAVSTGQVIRMLTMVDDCTRECPAIRAVVSVRPSGMLVIEGEKRGVAHSE